MYSLRTKLIMVSLAGLMLVSLYWLATHAFISVTVQNAKPSAGVDYSILKQDQKRIPLLTRGPRTIKRLVSRGNYEVLTRQTGTSNITITKVGGFLGTTEVSVRLQGEQSRKFIGNNPNETMIYGGQELLSYIYGDVLDDVRIHRAATTDQPTVVDQIIADTNGTVEGYADTKSGTVLLLRESDGSDGFAHVVYPLSPSHDLGAGLQLAGLNGNIPYEIAPYREGFLIFDADFTTLRYYASTTSKPIKVAFKTNIKPPYEARGHIISDETIALVYGSVGEGLNTKEGESKRHKIIVAIRNGNQIKEYKFREFYDTVELCGRQKLCMLGNKYLDVFDISDSAPRKLYSIGGVTSFTESSGSLLVARQKEIFNFDVNNQVGYIGYDLGGYEFCGIEGNDGGYAICLVNNRQQRIALQIDKAAKANDYIDKQVYELLRYAEVDDVSIYGKFITITPELGPSIYNPAAKDYGPDPVVQQRVTRAINQAITKLGINRQVYTITTTF